MKFKSGRRHEKHAVPTWNVGNHLSQTKRHQFPQDSNELLVFVTETSFRQEIKIFEHNLEVREARKEI